MGEASHLIEGHFKSLDEETWNEMFGRYRE
jgi:hypothetical protein